MRTKLITEWQRFISKARADATWERQSADLQIAMLGMPLSETANAPMLAVIALHQANAAEQDRIADLGELHMEEFIRSASAA